jgi:hypothetical protein
MTRISFGDYRSGVRDPTFRATPGGAGQGFPTPTSIQWATITRHHQESPEVARDYMVNSFRRSSYWGPSGTPQSRGWAESTLRSYDAYALITRDDTRPVVATGVRNELQLPPHALSVRIDVILLDPRGYVPRILLWDTNEFNEERGLLYAAPILVAAEEELGQGRVTDVEVVHTRTAALLSVSAAEARAASGDMAATVSRILSGA